jgi:copper chaperone CopZ
MKKITLKIDGMRCGMCESHVSDVLRRSFVVSKVSSSALKGEAVIICEQDIPETDIKAALDPSGYRVIGYSSEEYVKKSFFSYFRRKK